MKQTKNIFSILIAAMVILLMFGQAFAIVGVRMGERPSGRDHIEEVPYGLSVIKPNVPFGDPIYEEMHLRELLQFNISIPRDVALIVIDGGIRHGDYNISNLSYDIVRNAAWAGISEEEVYSALASVLAGNTYGMLPGKEIINFRIFEKKEFGVSKVNLINALNRANDVISLQNGYRIGVVDLALDSDQLLNDQDVISAMASLKGKAIINTSNGDGAFPSELKKLFDGGVNGTMVVTQAIDRQNQFMGKHFASLRDIFSRGQSVQFENGPPQGSGRKVSGTDTASRFTLATIVYMLSNKFLPLSAIPGIISNTATQYANFTLLNAYAAYKVAVNFTTPPTPVTKLEILGPDKGVINQGLTYNCGSLLPPNPRFEWRVKPVTRTDEGDLVSREPVLRSIGFAVAGDFLIGLKVFDANSNLFGIGSKAVSITDPTEPVQISIIGTTEVIVGEGVAYEVVGSGFDPVSSTWTIDGVIKANGQRFDPAIFFNVGINFSQVHLLKVTARDKRTGQFVSADLLVTADIRDNPRITKAIAVDRTRLGKRNRLKVEAEISRPDAALLNVVAVAYSPISGSGQEFPLEYRGGNKFRIILKDLNEPPPAQIYLITRKQSGFGIGVSPIVQVQIRVK